MMTMIIELMVNLKFISINNVKSLVNQRTAQISKCESELTVVVEIVAQDTAESMREDLLASST